MKVGLIGYPVGHSLSGIMHNAEFMRLGLDWHYELWQTPAEGLGERVQTLCDDKNVRGFNVTVPHKLNVMKFLDRIDSEALHIGAVNTVVRQPDGTFVGRNTDCDGWYQDACANFGQDFLADGGCVLLLGCGGVSRAVAAACVKNGAQKVIVACRRRDAGIALAKEIMNMSTVWEKPLLTEVINFSEITQKRLEVVRLIVNCTPLGMHGLYENETSLPKADSLLNACHFVYDTVYTPAQTKFLMDCHKSGCRVAGGLGMLVAQGALAFEQWTGITPDRELMKKLLLEKSQTCSG